MELGPEDVYLLERCPHFRGLYIYVCTGQIDVFLSDSFQRVLRCVLESGSKDLLHKGITSKLSHLYALNAT